MLNQYRITTLIVLAGTLFMAGCDSTDSEEEALLEATLVEDVPADPTSGRDPNTGAPISTNRYTLFSLRANEIVLRYDEFDRSDSASTAWDIGFQGTNIILNGGASGPGQGAALIVEDLFENVAVAPADAQFRVDGTASCTGSTGQPSAPRAICTGSGNGWYNYNAPTNLISPIPGRVIVVRTADGRFAKIRLLSYYKGHPETVDPATDEARYFTFEYVFQEDGSRNLASAE